ELLHRFDRRRPIARAGRSFVEILRVEVRRFHRLARPMPRARRVPQWFEPRRFLVRRLERLRGVPIVAGGVRALTFDEELARRLRIVRCLRTHRMDGEHAREGERQTKQSHRDPKRSVPPGSSPEKLATYASIHSVLAWPWTPARCRSRARWGGFFSSSSSPAAGWGTFFWRPRRGSRAPSAPSS